MSPLVRSRSVSASCSRRSRSLRVLVRVLACALSPLLLAPAIVATSQPVWSQTAPQSGLRVQLSSEEVTGVFLDRDTLQTHTPIEFSLITWNDLAQKRNLNLSWRVTDASGETVWQEKAKVPLEARGLVRQRELFQPTKLGSYRLTVEAFAKRDGRDDRIITSLPFAVVAAPTSSFRPKPFFSLTTPALLSDNELDFYERIGARLLRSPWLVNESNSSAAVALERQLQQRLTRGLETRAVLPLLSEGNDALSTRNVAFDPGASSNVLTDSFLPQYLTRFGAIESWEFAGQANAARWDNLSRNVRASRSDITLLGTAAVPVETSLGVSSNTPFLDGLVVSLPEPSPEMLEAGALSAGHWRALGAVRKRAGNRPFYTVQHVENVERGPLSSAAEMVKRATLALASGAAGASTQSVGVSSVNPKAEDIRLTCAAAYSTMMHLLQEATAPTNLFAASPLLWGVNLQTPQGRTAVIWVDGEAKKGARLVMRLPDSRVLDLFGNELSSSKRDTLVIPLSNVPVYVVSKVPASVAGNAWKNASLEGLVPLAVQALPLTQKLTPLPAGAIKLPPAKKKSKTPLPPAASASSPLQVRVQNVSIMPMEGVLKMTPPPGWVLANEYNNFRLEPGESKVYSFKVSAAASQLDANYPVVVEAKRGRSDWEWKQKLRLATADNVKKGQPISVDGDVSDWQDAAWMEIRQPKQKNVALSDELVPARVAVRWDENMLFVAAQVRENRLQPRRNEFSEYSFWDGYDALQLAFGVREENAVSKPGRGIFRDTDYGLLLSPYEALDAQGVSPGRVLKLWTPTQGTDALRDRVRWGGALAGSRCVVRRDERTGITVYEASWPLSSMPELQPRANVQNANSVRFSWILHNDEGAPLEWSRETGVFPWWSNTASFLTPERLHLAAQTPLGWSQEGEVDASSTVPSLTPANPQTGMENLPPLPLPPTTSEPLPPLPAPPSASQPPTFPARSTPPQATTRDEDNNSMPPNGVAPMPLPRVLPPAAPPPSGTPLPPSPASSPMRFGPLRNEPLPDLPPSPQR